MYCDVRSLCKFFALRSYLFLVFSRVPLKQFDLDFSSNKIIFHLSNISYHITCPGVWCKVKIQDFEIYLLYLDLVVAGHLCFTNTSYFCKKKPSWWSYLS